MFSYGSALPLPPRRRRLRLCRRLLLLLPHWTAWRYPIPKSRTSCTCPDPIRHTAVLHHPWNDSSFRLYCVRRDWVVGITTLPTTIMASRRRWGGARRSDGGRWNSSSARRRLLRMLPPLLPLLLLLLLLVVEVVATKKRLMEMEGAEKAVVVVVVASSSRGGGAPRDGTPTSKRISPYSSRGSSGGRSVVDGCVIHSVGRRPTSLGWTASWRISSRPRGCVVRPGGGAVMIRLRRRRRIISRAGTDSSTPKTTHMVRNSRLP